MIQLLVELELRVLESCLFSKFLTLDGSITSIGIQKIVQKLAIATGDTELNLRVLRELSE